MLPGCFTGGGGQAAEVGRGWVRAEGCCSHESLVVWSMGCGASLGATCLAWGYGDGQRLGSALAAPAGATSTLRTGTTVHASPTQLCPQPVQPLGRAAGRGALEAPEVGEQHSSGPSGGLCPVGGSVQSKRTCRPQTGLRACVHWPPQACEAERHPCGLRCTQTVPCLGHPGGAGLGPVGFSSPTLGTATP